MKVRVLSGNQKGGVVDLPVPAAESAIASGYAEAFVEAPAVEAVPPAKSKKKEPLEQ